MLPQVRKPELVKLANEFYKIRSSAREHEFIEYVQSKLPSFCNKKNFEDIKKAFRYVHTQKHDNIDESEWKVNGNYVYDNMERNLIANNDENKQSLNDSISQNFEPQLKKRKLNNTNSNNEIILFSDDIDNQVSQLIDFPQLLMDKINDFMKYKKFLNILVCGAKKCGKTSFVRHFAKLFNYQYFLVTSEAKHLGTDSFRNTITKYAEEYDRVILHFPFNRYPRKFKDNFQLMCDNMPSNIILMYEFDDENSVDSFNELIKFPKIGPKERRKYLEHFMQGTDIASDLLDEITDSTPGYQIGHIKLLCDSLKSRSKITLDICRELITSGVYKKVLVDRGIVTWQDIGGHDILKEKLMKETKALLDDQRKCQGNGILLYGPPGCGKTMLAKALSNELKFTFIPISCADILSKYQGESEKNVRDIFNNARNSQPCILFLDEIDALCSQRSDENNGSKNTIVTTFLTEIDGITSHRNSQLLIIGATNLLDKIDGAIKRSGRLGAHILVDIPRSSSQRLAVLMAASKDGSDPVIGSCSDDIDQLSAEEILTKISKDQYTEEWSHSDLSTLIKEAHSVVLKDERNENRITFNDFLTAHKAMHKKVESPFGSNGNKVFRVSELTEERIFYFNENLMNKISNLIEDELPVTFTIGGHRGCGKSTLIRHLARKYQYNLIKLNSDYVKCMSNKTDELFYHIKRFVKKYGRTIIHVLLEDKTLDLLASIRKRKFCYGTLIIFENSNERLSHFVIPPLNEEDLKRSLQSIVPIETNFDNCFELIKDWTYSHIDCLENQRIFIKNEEDLQKMIKYCNEFMEVTTKNKLN